MRNLFLSLVICLIFIKICGAQNQLGFESIQDSAKQALLKADITGIEYITKYLNTYEFSTKERAILIKYKGLIWQKLHRIDEAIAEIDKAILLFQKINAKEDILKCQLTKASMFSSQNKNVEATSIVYNALYQAKKTKNEEIELTAYQLLSRIYYNIKDFKKSLKFLKKCETIYIENGDLRQTSIIYNNMAVIYRNMGNLEQAIEYNLKSLQINKDRKDLASISKSYNNLGVNHKDLGALKKAKYYLNKSIRLNDSLGIINAHPLENLSNIYLRENKLDSATRYLEKALKNELKGEQNIDAESYIKQLMRLHLDANNKQKVSSYFDLLDSIQFQTQQIKRNETQQLLKDQESFLKKQYEFDQVSIKARNNQFLAILLAIFIFVLVLAAIQYFRYQKIKNQQEKLLLEQRILQAQMNPHFIYNALTMIQNAVLQAEPLQAAAYISNFGKLMRFNFDYANKKEISLKEDLQGLKLYLETQKERFTGRFDYHIKVKNIKNIDEILIPPMMIQPFVENAIEHGFKEMEQGGQIEIIIEGQDNNIHFTIKDNGNGLPAQTGNNREKENSTDIFIKRLELRSKEEKDSFLIHSNKGIGTIIEFTLKTKLS